MPNDRRTSQSVEPRTPDPSVRQPLTRSILLDTRLAQPILTGRVEVREIRMLPGHDAGLHVHNGPVFGSILVGSVIYQVEGGPVATLRPGDVFYEPADERVARFDATSEGVTFLAYFLLEPGQEPAITVPEN
jgi:quercetin dioxygenase-like cupin family protein